MFASEVLVKHLLSQTGLSRTMRFPDRRHSLQNVGVNLRYYKSSKPKPDTRRAYKHTRGIMLVATPKLEGK